MRSKASSIAIGDEDSFDMQGRLTPRYCVNDTDYPLALEGVTQGGHDVSISVHHKDAYTLYLQLQEIYGY